LFELIIFNIPDKTNSLVIQKLKKNVLCIKNGIKHYDNKAKLFSGLNVIHPKAVKLYTYIYIHGKIINFHVPE
jgi:hypothetical protein